ncbi:MAG: AAA family ATPase [Bacteroidales bacterium]|nr:AAA family ATPase [Candidatus Liminaster caballi]
MTNQNYNQQDGQKALDKFAQNLCKSAREGKLDPVIGRDDEIRRVLQILSRRTKNNPVLIGEPGTGKTAIVEGLAQRIVRGDVPENLKHSQVYSLDMGALIAGAVYKGEFEDRLKSVIKEVMAENTDGDENKIILFIDEIHTLVGAGGGQGAMDAANILKPALARGELRAIGATTLDEYQKYFESDKALERRFQKVMVDEPDEQSAIAILRGLKERYENHHKIRIKDEAVIDAVRLSTRYITDRFLPDKAIDLIDEASAKLRMEHDSEPQALDDIHRQIMQFEIEREAIKRENDKQKLSALEEKINALKQDEVRLRDKWETEKLRINRIQQNKIDIERLKFEAEQAKQQGDYARVAKIQYETIPQKEKEIEEASASDTELLKEEVTAEDIAEVVARWTGIPVSKMMTSEREKLVNLEEELHKRVVGQNDAIEAVSNAIRRNRAGLSDPKRPIGSFLFLGQTGVGKTELAKAMAEFLFDDERMLTRIDMSEYQEKFSVTRLFGAPPGYVGYDEGGQLTEAVRRKPYSVVLFDEVEKAHPDVFNTLLQVLDEGHMTDGKGREVNFKNTIIIMTSNLTENDLRKFMRQEFLNRIDEIVNFSALSEQDIRQVVDIQLARTYRLMKDNDITLNVTEDARRFLAEAGYDPEFGARPVKRAIQHHVLNALSKALLSCSIDRSRPIVVDKDPEAEQLKFGN